MPRNPRLDLCVDQNPGAEAEALCADGVFTVKQAIEFSGLSRTALFERMGGGTLASFKIGKRRLIPRRALVRLLASEIEQNGA